MGGNDLSGEADGRKEEINEGEDQGQLREGPELGRQPEEVIPEGNELKSYMDERGRSKDNDEGGAEDLNDGRIDSGSEGEGNQP